FNSTKKTSLLFSTLYLLELLGDEFKHLSKHLVVDFKIKDFENLKEPTILTMEQLKKFSDFYYNFSKEKLLEISQEDMEIYCFFYKKHSCTSFNNPELEILSHLRRITRYINALSELRVEMEF
ncbi:MAG: hypothetical protein ABIH42_06025, partial [Planctomycetota bacterium]